jgi:hypothetical protein
MRETVDIIESPGSRGQLFGLETCNCFFYNVLEIKSTKRRTKIDEGGFV